VAKSSHPSIQSFQHFLETFQQVTAVRISERQVHVKVPMRNGGSKTRAIAPGNLLKGHHGVDPSAELQAELAVRVGRFVEAHMGTVLAEAERRGFIDAKQRAQLDLISSVALTEYI
jgi:hypothetical protein